MLTFGKTKNLIMEEFNAAKSLEYIRESQNLNKVEMSNRCGISKSYYSDIINGHKSIGIKSLIRISREFNIKLSDLIKIGEQRIYKEKDNSILLTTDDFIKKTKQMLMLINEEYSKHWVSPSINTMTEEQLENINDCSRCNGYLYIEQGGDTVECDICNGTGKDLEPVFDTEGFCEFIEHTVMFGSQPFFDLISCEIKNH